MKPQENIDTISRKIYEAAFCKPQPISVNPGNRLEKGCADNNGNVSDKEPCAGQMGSYRSLLDSGLIRKSRKNINIDDTSF